MKRFTETMKWEDSWFSELEVEHKLAWLMILDRCDNAGVIDRPGRVMTALLGLASLDWDEFRAACNEGKERIAELENGKWWLTQFIGYQYRKGVSEASKQHGPIIESIKKNGLPVDYIKDTRPKPNKEVSNTSQDKDKDKDKDGDKGKYSEREPSREGGEGHQTNLPFGENFKKAWAEWETFRREKRQKLTESTKAKQLKMLSGWGESKAIRSIEKSITNGWTGLFCPDGGGRDHREDKKSREYEESLEPNML